MEGKQRRGQTILVQGSIWTHANRITVLPVPSTEQNTTRTPNKIRTNNFLVTEDLNWRPVHILLKPKKVKITLNMAALVPLVLFRLPLHRNWGWKISPTFLNHSRFSIVCVWPLLLPGVYYRAESCSHIPSRPPCREESYRTLIWANYASANTPIKMTKIPECYTPDVRQDTTVSTVSGRPEFDFQNKSDSLQTTGHPEPERQLHAVQCHGYVERYSH
jgi:hypothetical protein